MTDDGAREPLHITDETVRALVDEQFPQFAGVELGRRYTLEDHMAIRIGDHYGALMPRVARLDHLYARVTDLIAEPSTHWTFPSSHPIATGMPGHGYPFHWNLVDWNSSSTAGFVPLHPHAVGDLGRAIREIHQPAPEGAPLNPRAGRGLAVLREPFEQLIDVAVAKGAPENRELDPAVVKRIFDAGVAAPVDLGLHWTHGRLEPRAVQSDRGEFAGILIWHCFGAGDPAADLGYAANLVPLEALDEYRGGYGETSEETIVRARAFQVFAALGYIFYDDPFLQRMAWERLIELGAVKGG
ncbi:phosphotransferase [Demequina activiva]|uniref:Aminoglycoside phosphotransferase n=1 Tax=Demequina activiva TaxID=1582364 RepID=A0A919UKY6_9MICO|nr:phosphotransferase [Demequina activiva]GIG54178.1 aminoglycoside phosphotransferase [Demequina activiva]